MTDDITPHNDNRGFILLLLATLLGLLLFSSCTTKQYIVRQDSIMVTKTDTVTRNAVSKETVWRDRLRDRFVVVNALGDTVRDIRKEYVHVRDTVHDTVQVAAKSSNERHITQDTDTQTKVRSPTNMIVIKFWCFIAVVIFLMVFFFHKKNNKT